MRNIYKLLCLVVVLASFFNVQLNNEVFAAAPQKVVKNTPVVVPQTIVAPTTVVNNPSKYLNKNITFTANFIAYTSLGLDYKPAYKDPEKYIGILIERDDVKDHVIPLSEMKIFILRTEAEKHVDLDSGDKIKISGIVFSTALGDAWVDVKSFDVITQKNKDKK